MKLNMISIVTTCLMLVFMVNVNAALITDRAVFSASINDAIVDDYSDPGYVFQQNNVTMSAVLGETSYQSTGFSFENNLVPNEYYCAGCNGSFILDFTSTSIGSFLGVYGVGFEFFNSISLPYFAFITFGDGTTENFALPAAEFNSLLFFGFSSDLGITSIALGNPNGETTVNGSFGIDNLTIGCDPKSQNCFTNNEVPEPSTIALFALVALGLTARRLKK